MVLKKVIRTFLAIAVATGLFLMFDGVVMAQEVSANLHIKVEASSDNGATWNNYAGTESSSGQTVSASPGGTILLRIKIWNSAATWRVSDLTGTAEVTNSSYVSSAAVQSADSDTNGTSYSGYFFTGSGAGAIASVLENGVENGANCETMTISAALANSFPTGETVITTKAIIGGYTESEIFVGRLNRLLGIAKAEGTGRYSTARIAVNVAATATPTATAASTVAAAAVAEDLPQTGDSGDSNPSMFLIIGGLALALTAGVVLIYWTRRERKGSR